MQKTVFPGEIRLGRETFAFSEDEIIAILKRDIGLSNDGHFALWSARDDQGMKTFTLVKDLGTTKLKG